MKEVKFIQTTSSKLASIDIVDGQVISLTDKSAWYYDTEGTRHSIDQSEFESRLSQLEANSASTLIGETSENKILLGVDNNDIWNNTANIISIGSSFVLGEANINCSNSYFLGKSMNIQSKSYNLIGIGRNISFSNACDSIAIGKDISMYSASNANLCENSICIGVGSSVYTPNSKKTYGTIAIGWCARAQGDSDFAVLGSCYNGSNSITILGHTQGNNAIAIGEGSRVPKSGYGGIAIGVNAVASNMYCTAIGAVASSGYGSNNDVKTHATAIGGYSNAYGGYSTALGYGTKALSSNSTAIGSYATTSNANSIQLGDNANLSSITAKVELTVTSDERDKTDITPIDYGAINFLNKIEPITYHSNQRILYIDDDENLSEEDKENKAKYGICNYNREEHAKGTKKGSRLRVGISAQGVQKALEEVYGTSSYANLVNDNLFDYNKDEIPEGIESQLAVNYPGFVPFLIKAIQELSAELQEVKKQINM